MKRLTRRELNLPIGWKRAGSELLIDTDRNLRLPNKTLFKNSIWEKRTLSPLPPNHTIHHFDGNKFNCEFSNLIALPHKIAATILQLKPLPDRATLLHWLNEFLSNQRRLDKVALRKQNRKETITLCYQEINAEKLRMKYSNRYSIQKTYPKSEPIDLSQYPDVQVKRYNTVLPSSTPETY